VPLPLAGELGGVLGQPLRPASRDVGLLAAHALGVQGDGGGGTALLSGEEAVRFSICTSGASPTARFGTRISIEHSFICNSVASAASIDIGIIRLLEQPHGLTLKRTRFGRARQASVYSELPTSIDFIPLKRLESSPETRLIRSHVISFMILA
jgi:hypothetical protein